MTVGAKNNYTRAIKLELTFFSFGFLFLKFSLVFLAAEEDYKTYKQKQSEVNKLTTTYAGVLRHAQQQDKLNAKRIIHGICSIFRLFLYQINTKFVLTVSRRIHFLSSIHQHLNHAPQKKKTNKTSAKRHDNIVTPQLPRYNKLDSPSSEKTLLRKFGRFRGMTQMTLLKGLSSARSKTVCEIRIADKERTEKLSKISLRRQSKFTKSERLCSINVVLSY